MKIALVTGASSGIGEATAKRLLSHGFAVYAAARRQDRLQSLAELGAHTIQLDLTDDPSIINAIERINAETGRLDVLVNNAGYGSYGALEDVPLDEGRRQFEVNLFGLVRLSQLALPIMRAQSSGRIINVTSIGGKLGEPFGSWYHATKFAVEGLSDCLRIEVAPFGIDVVVIEPGAIRTEWGDIAHDSLIAMSGTGAYGTFALKHARMHDAVNKSNRPSPPEVVAKTIVEAASVAKPKTRYAIGGGARMALFVRKILSDRMFDRLMWKFSQASG